MDFDQVYAGFILIPRFNGFWEKRGNEKHSYP